jgi:hypothetical protein
MSSAYMESRDVTPSQVGSTSLFDALTNVSACPVLGPSDDER